MLEQDTLHVVRQGIVLVILLTVSVIETAMHVAIAAPMRPPFVKIVSQ